MTQSIHTHRARYGATSNAQENPMIPAVLPLPLAAPAQPTLEDRLDVVSELLDQLAAGVNGLIEEAPRTARRLDEAEAKLDHLVNGLAELLTATQAIAQRLDAEESAR